MNIMLMYISDVQTECCSYVSKTEEYILNSDSTYHLSIICSPMNSLNACNPLLIAIPLHQRKKYFLSFSIRSIMNCFLSLLLNSPLYIVYYIFFSIFYPLSILFHLFLLHFLFIFSIIISFLLILFYLVIIIIIIIILFLP